MLFFNNKKTTDVCCNVCDLAKSLNEVIHHASKSNKHVKQQMNNMQAI